MVKRLFDITACVCALLIFGPVILLAAIGVKLSSRGPAFYCAQRAGVAGRSFTLFKLRTMHVNQEGNTSTVTGRGDSRIFGFGQLLRKTKIDELPQLVNVIRGDMSIVGPRPEDPNNVERFYDELAMSTLTVRPGLTGLGSIYNYTHGEKMLTGDHPEQVYAQELLPIKMALEAHYLRSASFVGDLKIICRTVITIACIAGGRADFPDPPEMKAAREILAAAEQSTVRAA